MSTDLIHRPEHGYKLSKFYGGDQKGKCLQITPLAGDLPEDATLVTVGLTSAGASALLNDLAALFTGDPTHDELATTIGELGEDRDRLYKEVEGARAQAAEFEEDLRETRQELEEQKQHARELFDEAKAARKDAAEAREEARAAATDRRKERERAEVLEKELAHAREELAKAGRDLSRALGYIDRVVEAEPPVTDPIAVVNRQCGDVGESFISGPQRRGPSLGGGFRGDPWR